MASSSGVGPRPSRSTVFAKVRGPSLAPPLSAKRSGWGAGAWRGFAGGHAAGYDGRFRPFNAWQKRLWSFQCFFWQSREQYATALQEPQGSSFLFFAAPILQTTHCFARSRMRGLCLLPGSRFSESLKKSLFAEFTKLRMSVTFTSRARA